MHRIEEHIRKRWSDFKNATIFVGCSGGLDSIVLILILHKLKFKIEALHVNYQLRGKDSEKDALFVQSFCQEKNIPFHIKTIDLGKELIDGGNLQELARNVRYDWFQSFLSKEKNAFIAVAHHQDDQIETFFLNLARKSGVMGLAAMLEENHQIIRPLLPFSKDELREYALYQHLIWREDKSNSTNKYRRNFLRNVIIPLLNHQVPHLNESVLILVKVMQESQQELENSISIVLRETNENKRLKIESFLNWNDLEKVEFFRQLNQPIELKDELTQIAHSENGKRILLQNHPKYSAIVKQKDEFLFLTERKVASKPVLLVETVNVLPKEFNKTEIYLDFSKIKGKLKLRKWKIGDRIQPLGMKGSKLISDCIKDAHISIEEKSDVLIVHDEENIHWCVGLVIGRKAVANGKTKEILKITT